MEKSILSLLICFLIIGCSSSTGPKSESCDLQCQMAKSPYPDAEIESMALFLDSSVVAQEDTYLEIERTLTAFRAQYAAFDSAWWYKPEEFHDPVNVTRLPFSFPVYMGKIEVVFHDDSIDQIIIDGNYHAWDSLNAYYHLDSMHTTAGRLGVTIMMYFHPRLDGLYLASLYRTLPGVWYVSPSSLRLDGSHLFPWRDENGRISFLADLGWGDCELGCVQHRYYYFKQRKDIHGHYIFYLVGSFQIRNPVPSWWDEISPAVQHWLYY